MDKIRTFRDLEVWKLGKGIVLDVYQLITGQDNLLEKLDHESKMLRDLIKRL